MNALIYHGPHDICYSDTPLPTPKAGQVLVRVHNAGICGSDLHEYSHGPSTVPRAGHPHPLTKSTLPCPMGHEFAGTVASPTSLVSASGTPLPKDTKVVIDPRLYCHECVNCKAGYTNGCSSWGFHGLSGCCGGFSAYVAVDARMCYSLPAETDLSVAPLCEPIAVAWHAVKLCDISSFKAKNVLILGGGPIGLALLFVLRAWDHDARVWISEPSRRRREQCLAFGAEALDPVSQNVGEICMLGTQGKGVDFVFDAAGSEFAMGDGFRALAHRGTYVNLALWEKPFTLPFFEFLKKDATVKGSMCYDDEDFAATVAAFTQGKFKGCEAMITSRIPLKEAVTQGFDELINNKDEHIKIMIDCQE